MRMPKPRHNHSMRRWMKRTWLIFTRNRKIPDYSNPPDMPAGVTIHDAVEFVKAPLQRAVFPAPYAKESIYLANEQNPDWKTKILHYTQDTKLIEGYKQSLVLFNTLMYKGLPQPVQELVGKINLPDADNLFQSKLISEYFWDSTQELLPKHKHPEKWYRDMLREYGVTKARKVQGLENQIWSLCSMAIGAPSCQRHKMITPYVKVFFERENERVLSEVVADSVLLASEPLTPFDPNFGSSIEQPLVDIYPLSPLVDLGSINIYKEGNLFCVGPNSPKKYCHMLFIGDFYEKEWLEKQMLAKGIAACFSFAAAQAVSLFGLHVKNLPIPIPVNCILFGEQQMTFLSYQLNTLDLDKADGLKNQVWVDGPNQLFESYTTDSGLVGYNPSVLSKSLAFSLYGLKL